ncbi:MAG: hypothetical protein FWB88_11535 [Defluviitaleaceae bacterium]|nr:hypothetical protein [Defluviitaleaceae bacterium]MCL2239775.1 hypothetical protein [Defluviitaleaceae bacterium]
MKIVLSLFILAGIFLITSCAANPYVFRVNNDELRVYRNEREIHHGGQVFTYVRQVSGNTENIDITFPDGTIIWQSRQMITSGVSGAHGGGDGPSWGYNFLLQVNLFRAVERAYEGGVEVGLLLLSLVIIAAGVLDVFKPEIGWWLTTGWRFKNAEPSDLALGVARFFGVLVAIIGVVLFFTAL